MFVAGCDHAGPHPSIVRWRTALWASIAATPLFALVVAAMLPALEHGQSYREVKVAAPIGIVILANLLAWRWPRASGIALGLASPLLAVGVTLSIAYAIGGFNS